MKPENNQEIDVVSGATVTPKQTDDEKAAWMLNHIAQATPTNNPYKKV